MAGKQAKILSEADCSRLLRHVDRGPFKSRGRAMVLLSFKAGLRAGEIAKLTWPMVLTPDGRVGKFIELQDVAAKKSSGRTIPLHPDLRAALERLLKSSDGEGAVILSDRGGALTPHSVVRWFRRQYNAVGLTGCSSHSGRRTFITNAARKVHLAGGSLRDVQQLAGHKSIEHTQRYIEGSAQVKRRLVALI